MKVPALFEQVWASLPLVGFVINARDEIIDANAFAEAFVNQSLRALKHQNIWKILAVETALDQNLSRARATQTPLFINDIEIGTFNRAPTTCDMRFANLEAGTDLALLVINPRNLSGRLSANYPASSAARSAIGMADLLAHEIKNPLAGIAGAAQLLSMNLTVSDRELTDLIVGETRRIVKLLENVEQFGNLRPPELAPVNLHDLLDRARRSALLGFGAHMTIQQEYDPSLPLALGDPDQLLQVLLNLIKNACEARKGGDGNIILRTYFERSFRLRQNDGSTRDLPLQIEIRDDGPGLPADIRESVFEPFVSGRENGSGLGLALVSKIIAAHHAWVAVESVPGCTVFRLSLPRDFSKVPGAPRNIKSSAARS